MNRCIRRHKRPDIRNDKKYDKPPKNMFGKPIIVDPSKQITSIPLINTEEYAKKTLDNIKQAIETGSYEWTGRKSIILYVFEDTEGVVGSRYIKVNFEVEE